MLEIFEEAVKTTEKISEEWADIWDLVLLGDGALTGKYLFSILSLLGLVAASGTLIILAFYYFKYLTEGNYQEYFLNLLIPLIVVIFLSNNGQALAQFCFLSRGLINDINQQVLEVVVVGASLEEKFTELNQASGMQVLVSERLQQCEYLVGEEQLQCLQKELQALEEELKKSPIEPNSWREKLVLFLIDRQKEIDEQIKAQKAAVGFSIYGITGASDSLNSVIVMLQGKEGATFRALAAWMQGYQHFLEAALLITTLAAPLAVGGSLLPTGTRYALACAIGFFSVGFAKLSFNMMAGLTAAATINNINFLNDNVPLYMVFGFFAPVFSAALSAGGGMAVWSGMTSAFERTVNTSLNAVDAVIPG